MSDYKNVALLGAGGNLGREIFKALVDSGFSVTVISRADSTIEFKDSPAKAVFKGDYTADSFRKALKGQDALILALRDETFEWQKQIFGVAIEVGVKRILPAEFGSDIANPAMLKAVPLFQSRFDITQYLNRAVRGQSQTTWTGLVTGVIYDWCLERSTADKLWGFDIKNRKATIWDEGTNKIDTNNITHVAQAVTRILMQPNNVHNQYVYLSEHTVSQNDIFQLLLQATETSAAEWSVEHRSVESLRQQGYERLAAHDHIGALYVIFAALFEPGNGAQYSTIRKVADTELGLDKEDLMASTVRVVESVMKQA